ncbi:MAG: plasmid mobilization relaxosome protein MobC, partial [Eubacterium sp.]
ERSGYSQEAYIRSLIEGYVPRELPPADYHSMVKELRAIGNRMNQIAARANATGFFLTEEYAQNARRLFDEILEIRAAVVLPEKIR